MERGRASLPRSPFAFYGADRLSEIRVGLGFDRRDLRRHGVDLCLQRIPVHHGPEAVTVDRRKVRPAMNMAGQNCLPKSPSADGLGSLSSS